MTSSFHAPDLAPSVPSGTLPLVRQFCDDLSTEKISYCHWKSNNALDRSCSGDNDLDLLVARADIGRFTEVLHRLRFKQAIARPEKQLPGVVDYYGHDGVMDKWVHVHAHYQLVLGHDMTKNIRLPIEKPYLESAFQDGLFRVPAPEFEFIVFVIRMVLKHSTWDVILGGEGRLKAGEQKELDYLQARAKRDQVYDILKRHLPYLDVGLFDRCVEALEPTCSAWTRIKTGHELQTRLRANGRRSSPVDTFLKLWRRAVLIVRRRLFKSAIKPRLQNGGAIIALVGGDGAGKTTAVDALYSWLSRNFETATEHLGKPDWSWITLSIRAILKIGQLIGLYSTETSFRRTLQQNTLVSPGYPWLLREVCRARDRYGTYIRARRLAAKGGLVILDRFHLPRIQLMDGPLARRFVDELAAGPPTGRLLSPRKDSRLTRVLVNLEESYYREMVTPELLFVFRLDPAIAVQRRIDEDSESVRERSRGIWELNWDDTDAHIIDASQSKSDVLAELKAVIWSRL